MKMEKDRLFPDFRHADGTEKAGGVCLSEGSRFHCLTAVSEDLDRGFVNFFQKRAYPTFKSKHNRFQSYRTVNQKDNIRIVGRYLKLPKLGFVKIRQSMEVGKINHVTIEHTPAGKYFAVLNVDFEPEPRQNGGGTIGIDVESKRSILTVMEIRYQIPDIWNARCESS